MILVYFAVTEFLDRVVFQESDRVTACSGTSFFSAGLKAFQLGNVFRLFPTDTFTVFELNFVTENEGFFPADECPG